MVLAAILAVVLSNGSSNFLSDPHTIGFGIEFVLMGPPSDSSSQAVGSAPLSTPRSEATAARRRGSAARSAIGRPTDRALRTSRGPAPSADGWAIHQLIEFGGLYVAMALNALAVATNQERVAPVDLALPAGFAVITVAFVVAMSKAPRNARLFAAAHPTRATDEPR